MIRRLLPGSVVLLAVLATGLAAAPWLRTFAAATIAVPLFGAAVLSVVVPLVTVRLTRRSLLVTGPLDVALFVVYALTIVLHSPFGFGALVEGLHRGPSRLLSFALPLVSPRSLMIVPVALCWLVGAIAGEILARRPVSRLPFPLWLIGFGLAYAGTARVYLDGGPSNRLADTLTGAALLATMALLRADQTWLRRDADAITVGATEATERPARTGRSGGPGRPARTGGLPLRGLAAGVLVTAIAVAVGAAGVQAGALNGRPRAVQRVPAVRQSQPVTPLAFVSSLRPVSRTATGARLFSVSTDRPVAPYISLASVDYYDGGSWTFQRSFRPSGGVIPAEVDASLTAGSVTVTQQYRIESPGLLAAPWMPYLARPQRVGATSINVDPVSGMIVPTTALTVSDTYSVRSLSARHTFDQLGSAWLAATSPPPLDTQLPGSLRGPLVQVTTALADETGQASGSAPLFLAAVVRDLRANYALTDPGAPAGTDPSAGVTPTARATAAGRVTGANGTIGATSGGTSFAAVLAAILGDQRAGTPEQYATLIALLARNLSVPARVVSGFRLPADSSGLLAPGAHEVTASQAYTWVEIPVRGEGWVVLDPSPTRYADSTRPTPVGAETSTPPAASATNNALVTQASGGHAVAPKSTVTGGHRPTSVWLLVIPAMVVVVALLLTGSVLGQKGWRRRRRMRGDPRARVVGAWQESLDVLGEAGLGDVRPLTGAELTTASEARFGLESAGAVAVLSTTANRALYSSYPPIQPDDADVAWRAHGSLRRAVRRSLPWPARFHAAVRLRRR